MKTTLGPRNRGVAVTLQRPLGAFESFTPGGIITSKIPAFQARWAGLSQTQLPPEFVVDLLSELLNEVVKPFSDLQWKMINQITNVGITSALNDVMKDVNVYWGQRLMPVMLEAIKARDAGVKLMPIVIPGARTADQTLSWHVTRLIIGIADGYDELARLAELRKFLTNMGWVAEAILRYFVQAGEMVQQVKCVLKKGGDLLYAPIGATKVAVDVSLRLGAGLGVGYLLYKTRKPGQSPLFAVGVGAGISLVLMALRKKPPPPASCA